MSNRFPAIQFNESLDQIIRSSFQFHSPNLRKFHVKFPPRRKGRRSKVCFRVTTQVLLMLPSLVKRSYLGKMLKGPILWCLTKSEAQTSVSLASWACKQGVQGNRFDMHSQSQTATHSFEMGTTRRWAATAQAEPLGCSICAKRWGIIYVSWVRQLLWPWSYASRIGKGFDHSKLHIWHAIYLTPFPTTKHQYLQRCAFTIQSSSTVRNAGLRMKPTARMNGINLSSRFAVKERDCKNTVLILDLIKLLLGPLQLRWWSAPSARG